MWLDRPMLTLSEELRDFTVGIVQVAKDPDFGGASGLTSGRSLSSCQSCFRTEIALLNDMGSRIDISCIIGAGCHAVGAHDALLGIN